MRRGLPPHAFDGRPHIAIANTASDLTPCNAHLNEVAESVKQGVYEAGGIPLNLPVISLGETQVRPTAMLWRNMAAMATEEMLRANPIDGVVLLGGGVRDGDVSTVELAGRVPDEATVNGFAAPLRGWEKLYVDHVMQADTGADLDFLVGSSGDKVSRESH